MPDFFIARSVHVPRHFNVSLNPISSVYVPLLRRMDAPTRLIVNPIYESHPPAVFNLVITAYVSGQARFSFFIWGAWADLDYIITICLYQDVTIFLSSRSSSERTYTGRA